MGYRKIIHNKDNEFTLLPYQHRDPHSIPRNNVKKKKTPECGLEIRALRKERRAPP